MAPFSDSELLDLIGDLANYLGAPGPNATSPTSTNGAGGAQHPFEPLLATLVVAPGPPPVGTVTVGGSGQRCLLPSSDGIPNPCTQITAHPFVITSNATGAAVRIDLIVGESNYTGTALDATFTYVPGIPGGGVPTVTGNVTPVVQIIMQPGASAPADADVQVILPALTFVTFPAGSGSSRLGGGIPITAAVVTAAPFNVPYLAGNAQTRTRPTVDAMAGIQNFLTFLGPGGAIYVPSGLYGVKTTASTLFGKPGGANTKPIGQTIIFGGQVTFIALEDMQALTLNQGAVTIGCPYFYDIGLEDIAITSNSAAFQGTGETYIIPATIVTGVVASGQRVVLTDDAGNTLTGSLTSVAGGNITIVSTFEQASDGTVDPGPGSGFSIGANATMVQPVTSTSTAVGIAGGNIRIDAIETNGWANGVEITQLSDSEITSLRCLGVGSIGVEIRNDQSIHDNHINSIYCVGGGYIGDNPQCGLDIAGLSGMSQQNLNSLKIDHVEALGFNGPVGPAMGAYPTGMTSVPAVGVAIRGPRPKSIWILNIFTSSVGIGLYIDAGVIDVGISLINAGGDGYFTQESGADNHDGFNIACVGLEGSPVQNVRIGCARAGRSVEGKVSQSNKNGIYLLNTVDFHCDYGFVGDRNETGVLLDVGCVSIGFDHLVLVANGADTEGAWGIQALGTPGGGSGSASPVSVSIDKLDVFAETAPSGAIDLDNCVHLSYNDLGFSRGYFTNDGGPLPSAVTSPEANGFTVGPTGSFRNRALAIGNVSTLVGGGQSFVGTDAATSGAGGSALNTIFGALAAIWSALGGTPDLALDLSGNLAIAGAIYLPAPSPQNACVISSGTGVPGSGTPGNGKGGSLFLRTDGLLGQHLYVYSQALPTPGWHAVSGV